MKKIIIYLYHPFGFRFQPNSEDNNGAASYRNPLHVATLIPRTWTPYVTSARFTPRTLPSHGNPENRTALMMRTATNMKRRMSPISGPRPTRANCQVNKPRRRVRNSTLRRRKKEGERSEFPGKGAFSIDRKESELLRYVKLRLTAGFVWGKVCFELY